MGNMALAASYLRACRDNDANTESARDCDVLCRLLMRMPSCKEWGSRSMFSDLGPTDNTGTLCHIQK